MRAACSHTINLRPRWISTLAAGEALTCVLLSNGNVDCYGQYLYPWISVDYVGGDAVGVVVGARYPALAACVLRSNGTVYCSQDSEVYHSWYGERDAVAFAFGYMHMCVLRTNGNVKCSGDQTWGQSESYYGEDAVAVTAGEGHTCVLKANGNVDCYGNNDHGQSEDYDNGDAVGVAARNNHTCVLRSNGNVDCYGDNSYGQSEDYTGEDAVGVATSQRHTCVLRLNGTLVCWGSNSSGQANPYTVGDAVTECAICEPGCDECSNLTTCTACGSGYFLHEGDCVTTCPTGTFADGGLCTPY